jgi:hypothetical protein
MAVSSRLKQTQLGREDTPGSAVAATARWTGPAVREDGRVIEIVKEAIGQYADRGTTYIADLGVQGLAMEAHPISYEELLHILEAGIDEVSPVSGNGAPYTSQYDLPGGGTDATVKTYTIETDDGVQVEEMAYCFVESFELRGAANGALQLTAKWRGRQWAGTTITGSLSLPSVEVILFNKGKLYIDDSGGSVGSNQIANSFAEFALSVKTGLEALQTGEGNLYFSLAKRVKPEVTLSITAEHTSDWNAAGEAADFRAGNIRLVRIIFTGSSNRQLTIDLAGIWKTYAWGDRDGNSVITGTMEAVNSATDSLFLTMEVVHNLSAVP